jgi:hypothetical protein
MEGFSYEESVEHFQRLFGQVHRQQVPCGEMQCGIRVRRAEGESIIEVTQSSSIMCLDAVTYLTS